MDKKCFKLTVKVGTQIISSQGDYVVEDIPHNALEYLERGSTWLVLTPEAHEELKALPDERLKALITLRKLQGFEGDVAILEKALKGKEKSSVESRKSKKNEPSGT